MRRKKNPKRASRKKGAKQNRKIGRKTKIRERNMAKIEENWKK